MMPSQKLFNKHQFVSTALAIAASVAAVAAFVYGATTIGTNVSVDGSLTVSGSAATSTFSTGGLTVGTSQFVVQQTSGNIGIGTTTPWGLLSVNPNALAANMPQFVVGSSTKTSFVIANSGDIGIGTADPAASHGSRGVVIEQNIPSIVRVDLANTDTSDNVRAGFIARASTAQGVIDVYGAGNTGSMLGFANANVVDFQAINSSALVVRTSSAAPVVFGTNNVERMRILSGGNVGIGTTTPYSRFHVTQGASATTTVNFGEVGSATSKACFNTKNVSGADISFYFSAANTLVVENNLCR